MGLREGEILYDILTHEIKKKKIQMNSFTKQRLTDLENEIMLPKGKG